MKYVIIATAEDGTMGVIDTFPSKSKAYEYAETISGNSTDSQVTPLEMP